MKKYHFDHYLLAVVSILIILGILVLTSVSAIFSQEKFGNTTHYLFHQIIYGLIPGIVMGFIVYKIPLSFFKKWIWIFVLANLVIMALVFVPKLGITTGGAPRWLNLRLFSFQPSEFLKLSFFVYLSVWLVNRAEKNPLKKTKKNWRNTLYTLVPFLIIIGLVGFLLTLQSDVGTLCVIVLVAILIYFSASTPFWHSILIFSISIGAVMLLIKLAPYRMQRFLVFLNPDIDPMGMGYQIKQALITIGSGGIFGLGLGMSKQKFGFLPQSMSDSIFAIFAEETGFIGSFILVLLYLIFLWRSIKIAKNSQDKFSQLFVIGISSWICIQAFVNIGSMIGILPLTGIPLPFISYGGSHLVAELIGVGILLNISKSVGK